MGRYLIIVSYNRPDLFLHLSKRQSATVSVILDRRQRPRPKPGPSGMWHDPLKGDGYIIVPIK